tara:strand:- start:272 stop:1195 length:924 start_codon:yes stop_codon:yes gene_type:complete
MAPKTIHKINSIAEFHALRGLQKPEHPLISLIDYSKVVHLPEHDSISWLQTYYSIALKRNVPGKYRYGQMTYDFDGGLMSFFAPNQLMNVAYAPNEAHKKPSGWILLVHPDFLWGTALAKSINNYSFFNYALTEALFLSEKEELAIANLLRNIQQEYRANLDKFSQNIIISQIELLLQYAERYYERQFITRKIDNHHLLNRLEVVLRDHFDQGPGNDRGLPTVQNIAATLNVSPNYLGSALKYLTGQSTQQHIHEKLIEKAKEKLSTTPKTVSEIAYDLGFEHPQSFSKLFKSKTNLSPLAFRQAFN